MLGTIKTVGLVMQNHDGLSRNLIAAKRSWVSGSNELNTVRLRGGGPKNIINEEPLYIGGSASRRFLTDSLVSGWQPVVIMHQYERMYLYLQTLGQTG